MKKKEFAETNLNLEHEAFVVHVAALNIDPIIELYPLKSSQIAHLKADEASTKVLGKYTDFVNVFLLKLTIKLPKHIEINNYAIKFVDDYQPLYGPSIAYSQ